MPEKSGGKPAWMMRQRVLWALMLAAAALALWGVSEPKGPLQNNEAKIECHHPQKAMETTSGVAPVVWFGCTQTPAENHEDDAYQNADILNPPTLFTALRHWLHKVITDPISFLTLVLALSTIGLWIETGRLAREGNRQHAASNRAFVFIDGFTPELTTAAEIDPSGHQYVPDLYKKDLGLYLTRLALLPRWKNSGNTHTRNMKIQVASKLFYDPSNPDLIPEPDYEYNTLAAPFFLAPGATELSDAIEMTGAGVLIDWSFNPVGKGPIFLIWGRAEYEDVFGDNHFIEWCYKLRLERHDRRQLRAGVIQWGDHNRSD
jgi:hypothetical protein